MDQLNFFRLKKFWAGLILLLIAALMDWNLAAATAWFTSVTPSFFLDGIAGPGFSGTADELRGIVLHRAVGPLANVFAFGALLLLTPVFLAKPRWIFAGFFIFLLIVKGHVLLNPPYGDAIGGPFAEALFLADHNFDYRALAAAPTYLEGGQNVYLATIYPFILALGYKLVPSVPVFLSIFHLLTFFMTAVIAQKVYKILSASTEKRVSFAGAVFFLALPLVQSQSEVINMEIPCLFFGVLSIAALCERRFMGAAGYAALSAAIKGHGLIICAAVIVTIAWQLAGRVFLRKKTADELQLYGAMAICLLAIVVKMKFSTASGTGLILLYSGWPSLKMMPITYIYLACLILAIVWLIVSSRKKSFPDQLFSFEAYPLIVLILVCGAWFGLFLNFQAVSPRYQLMLAPFLVMLVIHVAGRLRLQNAYLFRILMILTIFAAVGSHGYFFPRLKAEYHVLLERSLEYRSDLLLTRRVVTMVEEKYPSKTIVAPHLIAQALRIPRLGYVREPRAVVAFGMPVQYAGIKQFEGLGNLDIMNSLWFVLDVHFAEQAPFPYPLAPNDIVIEDARYGKNRIVLLQGGLAFERKYRILKELRKIQKQGQQ